MDSSLSCSQDCLGKGYNFCRYVDSDNEGHCCDPTSTDEVCQSDTYQCSTGLSYEIQRYFACPLNTFEQCSNYYHIVEEENLEIQTTLVENSWCYYEFQSQLFQDRNLSINITVVNANSLSYQVAIGQSINSISDYKDYSTSQNLLIQSFGGSNSLFLLFKSTQNDASLKVSYKLNSLPQQQNPNINNGQNNTNNNTNNNGGQPQPGNNQNYQNSSDKGGSNVVIIVIIVLIVILVPLICLILFLVRRHQKKKQEQLQKGSNINEGDIITIENSNHPRQQQYQQQYMGNNGPIQDPENMQEIMQAIQYMEAGGNPPQNMQQPTVVNQKRQVQQRQEKLQIPLNQLPQFLQDLAKNDPQSFQELMANMNEEQLVEFISAQEAQQQFSQPKAERKSAKPTKDQSNLNQEDSIEIGEYGDEQYRDNQPPMDQMYNDPEMMRQQQEMYNYIQKTSKVATGQGQTNNNQYDENEQNLQYLVGLNDNEEYELDKQ